MQGRFPLSQNGDKAEKNSMHNCEDKAEESQFANPKNSEANVHAYPK